MKILKQDFADLKNAKILLDNPGLAARLTNLFASPIEKGFGLLPEKWMKVVQIATRKSLEQALKLAIKTMNRPNRSQSSEMKHKVAVALSGATGGAFGLMSLTIELPISTMIMLRSIATIARSEGEDLDSLETMLNCLQVFALGGKTARDDAAETGYYAIRAALSKAISDAAQYIAERGLSEKSAPVLVRFITTIASRFGIVVSEKIAAMAVPAVGAVGGAMVNTIFMDHFQKMAKGHFTIRRLERKYGANVIKTEYEKIDTSLVKAS
jgi:hydrogenase maturation factor HypF (carbamoyltransferase family)